VLKWNHLDADKLIGIKEIERFWKSGNRFSDKSAVKDKKLEPGFDSIKTGKALERGGNLENSRYRG